jgi:2-keto-3-deoxy-L-fuconate dehydrogenase
MRLKDKIAVVTAAGAGIGRATALAFHREGALVWASDIDDAAMRSLAAEAPGIRTLSLDVRDGGAVADAFARIGRCDVLFNCAGIVPGGTVLDGDLSVFDTAWNINLMSMVRTIRAALPAMLNAGSGSIVNMASIASSVKGIVNRCAYATTKAAVIGLTKSVAVDFVESGVRCNALCPGTIDTPSLRVRMAQSADPRSALAAFVARQPMGRLGEAHEIASAALYLASDESRFMTGQILVIDGGAAA